MSDAPTRHEVGNQDVTKPRVNGRMLANLVNYEVTLVGRVVFVAEQNQVTLETSSGEQVAVYLNNISDLQGGEIIEVTGVVQTDGKSIMESQNSYYSKFASFYDGKKEVEFDLETYDRMLNVIHSDKFAQLFNKY